MGGNHPTLAVFPLPLSITQIEWGLKMSEEGSLTHYGGNLRDLEFNLFEVHRLGDYIAAIADMDVGQRPRRHSKSSGLRGMSGRPVL